MPAITFAREPADDPIDWKAQLGPWLSVFSSGRAAFGFVADSRSDGSTFKRHGVLVRLCVDVTTALRGDIALLEKIREAIDLVQLVVAVEPTVIKSILIPRTKSTQGKNPSVFKDELVAMGRGVPVELRLEFSFVGIDNSQLTPRFLDVVMERLDGTLSTNTEFLTLRQQLLEKLVQRPESLKGVALGALNSPVRAQLIINSATNENVSEADTESFFENLTFFLTALDQYQHREKESVRGWNILAKHKAFRIEKIELRLHTVHVTSRVAASATALIVSGIPLAVSHVNLDFRFISCSDAELHDFLLVITMRGNKLIVGTGKTEYPQDDESEAAVGVDTAGEDVRDRVRMVMKAIGGIRNMHGLDMAGILRQCTTPLNREAVWRGLFEDVLSRDEPLELLCLDGVALTAQDEAYVGECVARWHDANLGKTVRVKQLQVIVKQFADINHVRALLFAFDDMEKLALYVEEPQGELSDEDLARCLQYPSLRSVDFSGVRIPTMDLFNPSILDPGMPRKPVLRELRLQSFELEDGASMHRFLRELQQANPTSGDLASTLAVLRIEQESDNWDETPIFDRATVALLDEMLATNRTLSHLKISVDMNDREFILPTMKELINKHSGRAVSKVDSNPPSEMSKARRTAFLSTVSPHQRGDFARSRLDPSLLRQIFAFNAPHATRTIGFSFLNM